MEAKERGTLQCQSGIQASEAPWASPRNAKAGSGAELFPAAKLCKPAALPTALTAALFAFSPETSLLMTIK